MGLSFGISVTVSVSSNKVLAVVVLVKPLFRQSVLSCRLSGESQTNCARLVKVRIVVALREVGLYDDIRSSESVGMCRFSVNCPY